MRIAPLDFIGIRRIPLACFQLLVPVLIKNVGILFHVWSERTSDGSQGYKFPISFLLLYSKAFVFQTWALSMGRIVIRDALGPDGVSEVSSITIRIGNMAAERAGVGPEERAVCALICRQKERGGGGDRGRGGQASTRLQIFRGKYFLLCCCF